MGVQSSGCSFTREELKSLLILGSEFVEGPITFSKVKVSEQLSFVNSRAQSKVVFQDSSATRASFALSTFTQGIALRSQLDQPWGHINFAGALIGGEGLDVWRLAARSLAMTRARLAGPAMLREIKVGFVDAGGARFEQNLTIQGSRLGACTLAQGVFSKRVDLRESNFGALADFCSDAGPGKRIVLDLSQAVFAENLTFAASTFAGAVRLRHMSVPAAKLALSWDDLKGRIDTGESGPELRRVGTGRARAACITGIGTQTRQQRYDAKANADALALVEEALRANGDVGGANAAYFYKERIRNDYSPGSIYYVADPGIGHIAWDYIGACGRLRAADCFWGYGVRPWRVAGALVGLWALLCGVLFLKGARIVGSKKVRLDWSPSSFPLPTEEAGAWWQPPLTSPGERVVGCGLVALHTMTGLRFLDLSIDRGEKSCGLRVSNLQDG